MRKLLYLSCFATTMLVVSCNSNNTTDETMSTIPVNLIPLPANMEAKPGTFNLSAETQILVPEDQTQAFVEAEKLADMLRPSTGFEIPVNQGEAEDGAIYLSLNQDLADFGNEGYRLTVSSTGIALSAFTPEGLFRGMQTLRQLFPSDIESKETVTTDWSVPGIDITDQPRFAYRGSMMDVARHFFSVEDVKRYIDLISMYKMNVLHLHLTDDQGWRIEIKSWPNLANYGGTTEVGGGEGGYYTQDQYQEIIAYAATKYMLIVPEIDMPGHTNAALASYPNLNYEGQAPDLYTGTEVGFSSLTTDKEITYQFVDDVVRELSEITPGPYIHIGADEAHATEKEDYKYFVNRAQEIVASHGKSSVGWQEILHTDILPSSVVQYWDTNTEIEGFTPETKVLMSPASKAYLDMKYHDSTTLGLKWAGITNVQVSYEWDPVTLVASISNSDILGVEAPIWAETTEDMADVEYLVFPRLPGIAEIGWSQSDGRSWEEYKYRLAGHESRFKALEINYFASPLIPWSE